jgi:hypothetical protein
MLVTGCWAPRRRDVIPHLKAQSGIRNDRQLRRKIVCQLSPGVKVLHPWKGRPVIGIQVEIVEIELAIITPEKLDTAIIQLEARKEA